jgi:hypothetical protein
MKKGHKFLEPLCVVEYGLKPSPGLEACYDIMDTAGTKHEEFLRAYRPSRRCALRRPKKVLCMEQRPKSEATGNKVGAVTAVISRKGCCTGPRS